jgi:para-aminobenzoate synthetase
MILGLPSELEVTAWTYDPEETSRKVLMGVQHRTKPIFGVQWHPESVCSSYGKQILGNFRDIVLDYWNISSPWNSWTRRSVRINNSLPQNILDASAIVKEATESGPNNFALRQTGSRPYYIRAVELGKGPKPQQVFESLVRKSTPDGEAWLDSAKVRDVHSRNSYLASAVFSLSYSTADRELSFHHNGKKLRSETLQISYWEWLNSFQVDVIQQNTDAIAPESLGQNAEIGQPILQAGLIGYFGYEMKRESLPGYIYSRSASQEVNESSQHTDAQLIFANKVLWLDNYSQTWKLVGLIRRGIDDPIAASVGLSANVGLTDREFDRYVEIVKENFKAPSTPHPLSPVPLFPFSAMDNEETYSASIQAARSAIREGESYELTLTTKFRATANGKDPYGLYLSLRTRNPAPYSAYLNFPAHDVAILSSSPERFISIDRQGVAEMKPIKGTVAVSADKEENKRRIHNLETDIKERAENLMVRTRLSMKWCIELS